MTNINNSNNDYNNNYNNNNNNSNIYIRIYSYTSLERISRDQVILCLRVKMP